LNPNRPIWEATITNSRHCEEAVSQFLSEEAKRVTVDEAIQEILKNNAVVILS
jgi:hypothetical protein